MKTTHQDANVIKLNLKNMHLINKLNNCVANINEQAEEIWHLSEECYKKTNIYEFNSTSKNAKKVFHYSKTKDYVSCQVYLIRLDVLIDSVNTLENKLDIPADVESNLSDIKDAINNIGGVLRELHYN